MSRTYAGQRAVVFGGAGFIGQRVTAALLERGASVVVFDRIEPDAEIASHVEVLVGDARDREAVARALPGAASVFALAGKSGATASIADPLSDLEHGPQAQLVLLEAVRAICPDASVVFPGSRLEYGKARKLPVAETHPLDGATPYAIHKSACAAYYRAYAEVHGLRTMVLRLSNPYGPHPHRGDFPGYGILNLFIDLATRDETIRLYGDGSQLRDLIYIDDVVEALLCAAAAPNPGEVVNVGYGAGVSLAEAARTVVDVVGTGRIEYVEWPADYAAIETGDFYFDVAKAHRLLGWAPKTALREGLELTLADA